jgi:hypothetical protein
MAQAAMPAVSGLRRFTRTSISNAYSTPAKHWLVMHDEPMFFFMFSLCFSR